jgi:hypothetical protein
MAMWLNRGTSQSSGIRWNCELSAIDDTSDTRTCGV